MVSYFYNFIIYLYILEIEKALKKERLEQKTIGEGNIYIFY